MPKGFNPPAKRTCNSKKAPVKNGLDLTNKKSEKEKAKDKLTKREEMKKQKLVTHYRNIGLDKNGNEKPKKIKSDSGDIPVDINVLKVHDFIKD